MAGDTVSIIQDIFNCYPRVSPIRKGFQVGACVHGDLSPERFHVLKESGFDYIAVDYVSPEWNSMQWNTASEAGLGLISQPEHFSGKQNLDADYLQTVNEPGSGRFWDNGPQELVKTYADAWYARDGRPIIGGNLSWLSSQKPEWWIKQLWDYGANGFMTHIGLHAYEGGPSGVLKRVDEMKKAWRRVGFRQPFWVTEFGWNDISDEKQARWTTYVLSKLSRMPDVVGASIYELRCNGKYQFGLFREDGTPRPVLARIKEARS